jgi:hypothetical protein
VARDVDQGGYLRALDLNQRFKSSMHVRLGLAKKPIKSGIERALPPGSESEKTHVERTC